MYQFHFTMLYITICYDEAGNLPMYKSSAIRGGMGQELLRSYCLGDKERCGECFLQNRCIVQNIMYAQYRIKPDFVTMGESAGYSLSCEDTRRKVDAGDLTEFRLILYGDTVAFFNPIIQALYGFGMKGLGSEQIRFHIEKIQNIEHETILAGQDILLENLRILTAKDYISMRLKEISMEQPIYMEFVTPCTIRHQGKMVRELTEETMVSAIWRRVYMQHLFEGFMTDPHVLMDKFQILQQKMELCSIGRHSGREQEKTQLSGIKGWIKLGNVSEELLQLLFAGEITCIGKNIRFGFGVYRVVNFFEKS